MGQGRTPTEPSVRIVGIEIRRIAMRATGTACMTTDDEVARNLPSALLYPSYHRSVSTVPS